ncbi:MAG: hypothetical protein NUV65_02250 [Candidatus Roizmanbacteria bacterium]|nr:hypothetical protein [Candidatus Roizmanbacteria bacterium]
MSKVDIYTGYLNQPPLSNGENYIMKAARPSLQFDRSLLNILDQDQRVCSSCSEGDISYFRYRNREGRNIDFHTTEMKIGADALGGSSQLIMPDFVELCTRHPYLSQSNQPAGSTEYKFIYATPNGGNGRLESQVKLLHLPEDVSPVVETLSVSRDVLNRRDVMGDISYGSLITQDNQIARRLGIQSGDSSPPILIFLPDKVVPMNTGWEVVGDPFSYEQLQRAGIKATFTDTAQAATLRLAAGDLSFNLCLAKEVKPNYPALLFGEREEWITDSGIHVFSLPHEMSN